MKFLLKDTGPRFRNAVLASAVVQALISASVFYLVLLKGAQPVYFLFLVASVGTTTTLLFRTVPLPSAWRWLGWLWMFFAIACLLILWEAFVH